MSKQRDLSQFAKILGKDAPVQQEPQDLTGKLAARAADLQERDVSAVKTDESGLKAFEVGTNSRIVCNIGTRIRNGLDVWIVGSVIIYGD